MTTKTMNTDKHKRETKESINFEGTEKKLDLARSLVRERYKINDDGIEAVEFIFWVVYFIERITQDMIIEAECGVGGRREAIQKIVDKLSFGDKISIVSDLYVKNPKKEAFIKLFWKVNDLRNAVAHGRFSELTYESYYLSGSKGQLKLINDFIKFVEEWSSP